MSSYLKTIKELYDLQQFSIKMGLENITALCRAVNNPQMAYPTIHIAGTNGKGSTAYILQKILSEYNLDIGLYTSPHLVDFCERIRVNDDLIDQNYICEIWSKIKSNVTSLNATFFDTTTAIAFSYFRQQKVDLAVIETGLGGRLDSTNIINPVAAVITPIDIDHSKQLGSSLEEIALEKAGIIKKGVTLFSGKQQPAAYEILRKYENHVRKVYYFDDIIKIENVKLFPTYSIFDFYDLMNHQHLKKIYLNLAAGFQIENAVLAYLVARWYLKSLNIKFNQKKFREILQKVRWRGRMDKVFSKPDIYFDVSHNVSGFNYTLDFIKNIFKNNSLYLLIGLLADKDYKSIVKLIHGIFREIVITEPENERALKVKILKREFTKQGIKVKSIKDLKKAFDFLIKNSSEEDTLFVMGSHFLVGELLKKMNKKP
jgi:dihydrofolate synthase/folylpolyglutamate synthase